MIRTLVNGLVLTSLLIGMPAWADEQTAQPFQSSPSSSKQVDEVKGPGFVSTAADAAIARPVLLAATILGTGLFIVTLPFSLLSNSVNQAGHVLVGEPAKATFERCLGCSFEKDSKQQP